jgi:Phage-related minor tail protein
MGNTIKGLTVEIGGDATKLGDALKDVNAKAKSLSVDLKGVNDMLKFDPSNTELLAQKQNLLTQAVDNTKDKLNTLREAQVQVQEQFEKGEITETQFNNLNREIASTQSKLQSYEKQLETITSASGKLKDTISGQASELNSLKSKYADVILTQGKDSNEAKDLAKQISSLSGELTENKSRLNDAKSAADQFDKSIKNTGNSAKDVSDGGFTIFKGMLANLSSNLLQNAISKVKEFAQEAISLGDTYSTLADVTNLSTDRLQELQYAGTRLDVSLDTMTGSFKKLINNMESAQAGSGTAYDAFQKLGVSVTDNNGQLRDSNDVWADVIDALGKVTNETERDALAQDLMGKSATELNPIIKAGSSALSELSTEAENTGAVMSNDAVNALDNFGEDLEQAKQRAIAFVGEGLAKIIDAGKSASEKMDDLTDSLGKTKSVQDLIDKYKTLSTKLSDTSLSEEEVKTTTDELDQAKQDLITASNGVITAFDIENGTFDAQVNTLENLTKSQREYYKYKLISIALDNSGTEAAKKLAAAQKRYDDTQAELNEAVDRYNELQIEAADGTGVLGVAVSVAGDKVDRLSAIEKTSSDQLATLTQTTNDSNDAIKTLVNEGFMSADEACTTFGLTADQLNTILSETGGVADSASTSAADLGTDVSSLKSAYDDAKKSAYDSINQQIGLFQEFDGSAKESIDDLTQTLLNQKQAMDQYADNLKEAARRGVDEGLIAKLSDGGQESAQILASIVAGSDDQIAKLNSAFEGVDEGANYFSSTVAGMQTDFDSSMNSMLLKANDTDPFNVAGGNVAEGFVNGILAGLPNASDAGTNLTNSTTQAMRDNLQSHSPSKVTTSIGQDAVNGFVNGLSNHKSANDAASGLGSSAMSKLTSGINGGFGGVNGALNTTVLNPFGNMHISVSDIIERIKKSFNFSWNLPHLSLPHLTITGGFSLTPPSVPHFSVSWYKTGAIFDGATIFGAMGDQLLGAGEAGKEALLPLNEDSLRPLANLLKSDMQGTAGDTSELSKQLDSIQAAIEAGHLLVLDTGELVGATLEKYNQKLGVLRNLTEMGSR